MVRVGGGWDTLENYLNKHDPCRRSGKITIKIDFIFMLLLNPLFLKVIIMKPNTTIIMKTYQFLL